MDYQEISRGAEAIIYLSEYHGRDAILKVRPPKKYRHPDLDLQLRNSRTKNEIRVIRSARAAGVRSPVIYDVDLSNSCIIMEHLKGLKVKDILDEHPSEAKEICAKIGEIVAKLHNNKICHGDLTTSNMILDDDGILCMIDFSLGDTTVDIEEMGVDLHLLERAFTSAHSDIDGAYETIIDSYRKNMRNAQAVLERVENIRSRGRYT
ncbi:MAG: KEOPS complex kinase/ATPase Bud32 [Candidatus Methanomethylophilaceae archaeon]|jgi:TP53 regulating kinase-like protein/N6-L-threonylcarbamoyladenine synthase/protein kinase Bud32